MLLSPQKASHVWKGFSLCQAAPARPSLKPVASQSFSHDAPLLSPLCRLESARRRRMLSVIRAFPGLSGPERRKRKEGRKEREERGKRGMTERSAVHRHLHLSFPPPPNSALVFPPMFLFSEPQHSSSSLLRLTAGDLSVQLNLNDYLDIYCPSYPESGSLVPEQPETLVLYLVEEEAFKGCVETKKAVKRWECNTPFAPFGPVRFSEKIQRFTPFSLGFEFLPGRHYYYSCKSVAGKVEDERETQSCDVTVMEEWKRIDRALTCSADILRALRDKYVAKLSTPPCPPSSLHLPFVEPLHPPYRFPPTPFFPFPRFAPSLSRAGCAASLVGINVYEASEKKVAWQQGMPLDACVAVGDGSSCPSANAS
ncbi:hypothetical protein CCH79_00010984 [Gambusia affinis]|uniref:Ephrin RBD domain-containing protein n=1 Tax=Gambusia affinis TaxID=33528 RepID=A0A315VLS8_GAMAF|nr:hypothetical protein CCH79_00010984 [Gambusia affinis]